MPKKWIDDRNEIDSILKRCEVGSLATVNPDCTPYVVTVNYVYSSGKIYFHGALKGKKMDNIGYRSGVCFEVHEVDRIVRSERAIDFGTRYHSVIINGNAREITDPEAKRKALIILTEKYADGQPFEPPSDGEVNATAVVEIEILKITGKKNTD